MKCSFQHFHAALLTQIINPNSFDAVFTILRDPMSRLQSEYRWRMEHGSGAQITARESGLEQTMDGLSRTLGEPFKYNPDTRRNTSERSEVEIPTSALTKWLIRRFYARDYTLHHQAITT